MKWQKRPRNSQIDDLKRKTSKEQNGQNGKRPSTSRIDARWPISWQATSTNVNIKKHKYENISHEYTRRNRDATHRPNEHQQQHNDDERRWQTKNNKN